jgi:hypothetical protein
MSGGGGKREAAKAQKATEVLIESWHLATEEAFEAELSYVTNIFRKNKNLLRSISSLLKNDMLIELINGTLFDKLQEEKDAAIAFQATDKPVAIKATITKFKQLMLQPGMLG